MGDAFQPTSKSTAVWKDGLAFDATLNGHAIALDADEGVGGRDLGPRPKGLMLTALIGCTGMDVAAILAKMKIVPSRFEVEAEASLTSEHPKVYDRIHLNYRFEGEDLPADKLERAVNLSQEKYCGVSAMLRPVVQLSRSIFINGSLHSTKEDPPPVAGLAAKAL